MKKSENIFQKLFSGMGGLGNSRIPLRSNIFRGAGKGYSPIGSTGGRNGLWNNDRQSVLLGNAQPSNRLSGYFDRVSELKGYQLLDISQMCVNFFKDYVINFIVPDSQQIISFLDEEGNINEQASERVNTILTKQLNLIDFIKSHSGESIFYGAYSTMIKTKRDDTGHQAFEFIELFDPVSTVIKRKRNKDGDIEEVCLARGDDGTLYEIPDGEFFTMGSTNLRLINDLEDNWKDSPTKPKYDKDGSRDEKNRDKVIQKESYLAGEPLFYSLILKVKELVIKELLVSLISLRDLSTPTLIGLALDKGASLEAGQELCARVQKMINNYNELGSFLSSSFDSTSFIESTLTNSAKVFPDYNGTVSNKNNIIELDKLSSKALEILQMIDQTRNGILSSCGIPSSITDSQSGNKWVVLQSSERAVSRVTSIMNGIKNSIVELAGDIYYHLYNEEIDPANIKVHIFEKSTVEYNNQINQSESISNLVQGISGIIQQGIQTLDGVAPLIDPEKFLNYLQTQIKNIDPGTEFITEDTIQNYVQLWQMKLEAQKQQIEAGGMM